MAKTKPPDDSKLLEGLLKALDGKPLPVTGSAKTPGLFATGKAGEPLIKQALELGYLEECPQPPDSKGKKGAKAVRYARITQKGHNWVLQHLSPREALEGLLRAFEKSSQALRTEDSGLGVLQEQLASLEESCRRVQQAVQEASTRQREDTNRTLQTLQSVSDTLKRLIAQPSGAFPLPAGPVSAPDLASRIEILVREWRQSHHADCPFHELYARLRADAPELTIGAFHDLLRSLHNSSRVRLSVWSGSPDRMKEPELGLFLSSTLMYYARTPDRTV